MLGCEEKILEECHQEFIIEKRNFLFSIMNSWCHLLPSSFPTRPATFTHSNSKYSYNTKITDNDKDILITKATFKQRQQHPQIVAASIVYDL